MNSSETRLTTDGTLKFDPVFTKSGEVVYTVLESAVQTRIMRLPLGGKPTKLHPDATTSEFETTFTADAGTYAFVQSKGNLNLKLIIRDAATGKDAVFDPGGGFAGVRRPSFHPNGERDLLRDPDPERGRRSRRSAATVRTARRCRPAASTTGPRTLRTVSGSRFLLQPRRPTRSLRDERRRREQCERIGKLEGNATSARAGRRTARDWRSPGTTTACYGIYVINLDGTGLVLFTARRRTQRLRNVAPRRQVGGVCRRTPRQVRPVSRWR